VSYGDAFGSEDFKLLEVDERILKELLQDGWVLDVLQKKNIIWDWSHSFLLSLQYFGCAIPGVEL
jgi:hypothetical protein